MHRSNRRQLLVHSLVAASFWLTWPWIASGQTPGKEKANADEKITLQYRTAMDASVPSGFLAVIGNGHTGGLHITWDIPNAEKRKLDAYLKGLERWEINGVEFECRGQWLKKGWTLRVTTVPHLTETGRKRIVDCLVAELLYATRRDSFFGAPGSGQTPGKEKAKADEKITLQYRVKMDMWASSGFIALIGEGATDRLNITWDIPSAKKKKLDARIRDLERRQINGVEFECQGQWEKNRILRVTAVPQLTEEGKKRIREHRP